MTAPPRRLPLRASGQAYTYEAQAHCVFDGAGRYQVRTFMSFGAETGRYDIERHYVGTYEVLVR